MVLFPVLLFSSSVFSSQGVSHIALGPVSRKPSSAKFQSQIVIRNVFTDRFLTPYNENVQKK